MDAELKTLSNGSVSLEFARSDWPHILEEISKHFGTVTVSHAIIHSLVKFGGASFIFYHEWEEACLISPTGDGIELLKKLCP